MRRRACSFFFSMCISVFFILQPTLAYAQDDTDYKVVEDQAKTPLLNPEFAERKILKIRLKNGLQAYLISDPHVDQSGAVLSVKAGSWEDPEQFPGLAHFLEHMLFLGTKKYPTESEYKKYISENRGLANAYTSPTYTSYMFSINNDAFPEALDRFSRFFIEPLFNPSGVSRELQAIDQEYAKNLEKDDFRFWYLTKDLANPAHPHHGFSIGNSDTLSKVDQETLKEWYKKNYSANLMRLVVYSPLPIEKLKELVVQDFTDVPNTNKTELYINLPLFTEVTKGQMIYATPIQNTNTLTIVWELPEPFSRMKQTKPERIACHVFGDEGPNSLLAELKKEGFADALECGTIKAEANTEFYIEIELTDTGVKEVNKVIGRTFQAIDNFKRNGVPEYLFDDVKQMDLINYQYQPREDVFNLMMGYADLIVHEDLESFPEQTLILQKFDPKHVSDLLDQLKPQEASFYLMAPPALTGVQTDKTEKWLKTEYTIKPIDPLLLKEWAQPSSSSEISLPKKNPYIPQNLKAIHERVKVDNRILPQPEVISDTEKGLFYYSADTKFGIPEIYWSFNIKTPLVDMGDPDKVVLADLYVRTVSEAVENFSHAASVAGLNYGIRRGNFGINLTISGYSEKAKELLEDLLKNMTQAVPTESQFLQYQESLNREYQNFSLKAPIEQAAEKLNMIIFKEYAAAREKALAIKKITYLDFQDYLSQLYKQVYVESMLYGNLDRQQAEEIPAILFQWLKGAPYPKEKQRKREVIVLPNDEGPFYLDFQIKSLGNAVILMIENPAFTFKTRAAQELLMQTIDEPFFATLRTKQQTAYLVYSDGRQVEKQLFDLFAVQSNTHAVRDLLARFEQFIESFLQELPLEVSKEKFDSLKLPLLRQLERPAKNLIEMGELLRQIAFEYGHDFDWFEKRINGVKELDYQEFLELVEQTLGRGNKRRVAILVKGNLPKEKAFIYHSLPNLNSLKKISDFAAWSAPK